VAVGRYITTSQVTLAPGTAALNVAAGTTTAWQPGTESFASAAGNYGSGGSVVIPKGTVLMLDPTGPVYTAIGAGNLTAFSEAQETGGQYGTAN
jgi:hypothetical protein